MSGHNKWSKIKRLKGKNDAEKSKVFGKLVRVISIEAKRSLGNTDSPALRSAIEKAREANVPNDNILRALKKANETGDLESITYEAYGPGGSAIIIEALTASRNKAAQEIKFILSKHSLSLAGIGSATWAFDKKEGEWIPKTTIALTPEDGEKLTLLLDELEANDEVQEVFTNAE
jgi:transcriptional/translational regulatory protein YebC/TACO1